MSSDAHSDSSSPAFGLSQPPAATSQVGARDESTKSDDPSDSKNGAADASFWSRFSHTQLVQIASHPATNISP
jgi:hypothetical protein